MLELEKVIFVPASVSPFRNAPSAPAPIRLRMLESAIEGEPGFAVDDCDLRRPPPSYTFDTMQEIGQREGPITFFYLIGEDNVADLGRWHRFSELRELVQFVVLDRTGNSCDHSYQIIRRKIDISATDIRKRVASGQSIRYLVPARVEQIIHAENLYREEGK